MNALQRNKQWIVLAVIVLAVGAALLVRDRWWPQIANLIDNQPAAAADGHGQEGHDDHSGHDHAGHDDSNSLKLSQRALRNIGYRPLTVKLQPFTKTTTVPAMVVERPGVTRVQISSQLTGVVEGVYVVPGQAVRSGDPLFRIR